MPRPTQRPKLRPSEPPRRHDWAKAIAAVRGLLVLHDVASRPPLDRLITVADRLTTRTGGIVDAYADLWRSLIDGTPDLRDAITRAIASSENVLGRNATGEGRPDPEVMAAVTHDLQAISHLVTLADQLHAAVRKQTSIPFPPLPVRNPEPRPASAGAGRLVAPAWDDLMGPMGATHLERHYTRHGGGHFARARAFVWTGAKTGSPLDALDPVTAPDDVHAADLVGSLDARALLRRNTANLLRGAPANNVLLYGDRGTGKSSSVKSLLNEPDPDAWGERVEPVADSAVPWHLLRLIEVPKSRLADFPVIAGALRGRPERFIVFVDDLSFEDGETQYKDLKALLDGGIAARPSNVVIYATSNRRHLIREQFSDRPDPLNTDVHGQDTVQEKLSFADRFGLTLTFTTPSQDEYVAIAAHLARRRELPITSAELRRRAISWAAWHNGRSGRTARQFIDDLTAELG